MVDERYCVILTSVDSSEEARKISDVLVEEKLAACVQAYPMTSTYAWDGAIHHENEILLLIKTREVLYGEVESRLSEIHSYDVPEIIQLPIAEGSSSYLSWISASTSR